ncbi:MAG: NF038122 family metalloprotease, partial [Tepidisphaeraceae bacterium]
MSKLFKITGNPRRARSMLAVAAMVTAAGLARPAIALVIDPTFDSSFSSLSNESQVEGAINYAIEQFEEAYSNPITVNITFEAENTTSFAGETEPNYVFSSYSSLRTAFVADAASTGNSNQMTAAADNWPATDPTGKGSDWYVPGAEGKALGVVAANSLGVDATIIFGFTSSDPYVYDPYDRAASETVDFIGVAEHEIAHGLGRDALLGQRDSNRADSYTPLDLYRFKSAGTLGLTSTNGVYYSINKGATNLKAFASSSDTSDWNGTSSGSYIPDSFNAISDASIANTLTPVDITEMDGLGFNPNSTNLTWNGGSGDFLTGNGWSSTTES